MSYHFPLPPERSSLSTTVGYTLPPLGTAVSRPSHVFASQNSGIGGNGSAATSATQSLRDPFTPDRSMLTTRSGYHQENALSGPPASMAESDSDGVELHDLPQARLFIDNLVVNFRLSALQAKDLHGLYEVATTLPGDLSAADIMCRVYTLASTLSSENRIVRALTAGSLTARDSNLSPSEMKQMLLDIKTMLDDCWKLSNQQKSIIRRVAKELIYKATRTSFKGLFADVNAKLRRSADLYRLTNVFGQPQRETILSSVVKKQVSAVRNVFRSDIRDSIIGKKACSLDDFTVACSSRYYVEVSAPASQMQGFTVHNVLLRRFAWENQGLFSLPEEDIEESDNEQDSQPALGDQNNTRKRKKGRGGGRIGAGDDFWSKVDTWFKEGLEQRGDNFSSSAWKQFIKESIDLDNARFNPSVAPATPHTSQVFTDSSEDFSGSEPSAHEAPTTTLQEGENARPSLSASLRSYMHNSTFNSDGSVVPVRNGRLDGPGKYHHGTPRPGSE